MVFNKKEFKSLINQLKPIDFNYIGNFGSARFVKKESSRTIIIGIGYNEYFPHSALIRGVLASIYFNDVEEIIDPFLEKYQIKNRYGNTTIEKVFAGLNNVDYSKFDLEIKNEESFNTVAEEIKKILNFAVMPFFERYRTLNDVNKSLTVMSEDEISIFLSGIVGIKMPLIKKLVKADDFRKELLVRKKFYDEEVFKYEKYFKDHEKVFYDIFAEDLRKI